MFYHCLLLDSPQRIINLRTVTVDQTSILVSWDLLETNSIYSNLTFSIYYLGLSQNVSLVNITTDLNYIITGLVSNTNYTIRVEFRIPFSTQIISATKYHFLEQTILILQSTELLTNTSNPVLIITIVIVLSLVGLVLLAVVVICFIIKIGSNDNVNSPPLSTHQNRQSGRTNEFNLKHLPENNNIRNSPTTRLSTNFYT